MRDGCVRRLAAFACGVLVCGAVASEPSSQLVRLSRALRALGVEPNLVTTAGGSDSNIFNARGIQTVNISTGMENVHSTQEYIALEEMVFCAQVISRALELG